MLIPIERTSKRRSHLRLLVPALVLMLVGAFVGTMPASVRASYPGRNGRIFFNSDRVTSTNPTGDSEIFTMRPDGSGLRQLTHNRVDDFSPALSADGQTVAFLSKRNGNLEVFVMNADGTGKTRLTHSARDETNPALSPDGTQVAFERYFNTGVQLFTKGVNGGGSTQITSDGDNRHPAWSPDGTRIAFARFAEDSSYYDIFTMNPNGGERGQLTFEDSLDTRPNWAPDGKQIAFQSNRETQDNPEGDFEIFVLPIVIITAQTADGWTQLTANAATDYQPVWSPDGEQIAFYREHGFDNPNIFVTDADGSGERRLTNNPADDSEPDWQPRP